VPKLRKRAFSQSKYVFSYPPPCRNLTSYIISQHQQILPERPSTCIPERVTKQAPVGSEKSQEESSEEGGSMMGLVSEDMF